MKLLLKKGTISILGGLCLIGLGACSPHSTMSNGKVIRYQTTAHLSPVRVNSREIVATHNQWRSRVGLPGLSWSPKLADDAQKWANHLKNNNNCYMRHRRSSPYGENLFWASPLSWSDGRRTIQSITSGQVVNDWGEEVKYYNYRRNSCQFGQQCGHYTQMVWKDTRQVGCGVAICNDKSQVWVCSYDPPGNYRGERPY